MPRTFPPRATLESVRSILVDRARRHSRRTDEAEDLAHDLLLAALRRDQPVTGESFVRNVESATRQHGAFLARSAARRRAREAFGVESSTFQVEISSDVENSFPLSALSAPLRTTLLLLHSGLTKSEVQALLEVTDATLRKRFQLLRQRAPIERPVFSFSMRIPAVRRAQTTILSQLAGGTRLGQRLLAACDPDGHGIIFSNAFTKSESAATSEMPSVNSPLSKGTHAEPTN